MGLVRQNQEACTDLSGWVSELLDFTLVLFHFRAEHIVPEVDGYPGFSILGLDEDRRRMGGMLAR